MRILFVVLLSAYAFSGYSQFEKKLEPAILECKYAYTAMKDTVAGFKDKEEVTVLRIGRSISQFFSEVKYSTDSLVSTPEGMRLLSKKMVDAISRGDIDNRPGRSVFQDYIYKNYPKGKLTNYTSDGLMTTYQCVEDYEPQKWEVLDSTKQILGYSCQLARCSFRGRAYFAWFTLDIPIKDGPWKLNGLPGLILEAYDSANHYRFTAMGISQGSIKPVSLYNCSKKYEKANRIALLKEKAEILFGNRNVMQEVKQSSGIDIGGSDAPRVKKRKFYDFMERDYR